MPDTTTTAPTAVGQITRQINQLLPRVIPTVIAVEQAIHDSPGETKLQIAVNAIIAGSHEAEGIPLPPVASVAGLVNLVVTLLNAFGIFNHGSKPNVPNHTITLPVAA